LPEVMAAEAFQILLCETGSEELDVQVTETIQKR
jgi:hypothetical protein